MALPPRLIVSVRPVQYGHYAAMPGAKYRSLKDPSLYEALRAKGKSKSSAAAISNAHAAGTINHHRGRRKRRHRGS